ncbi:MAG: signal peptidase I [Clostridia bacterium]
MEKKTSGTQKGDKPKNTNRLVQFLSNGLFALVIVMVIAMVFFVVQGKITGGPPMIAGHHMYIVLSGSMSPAFDTGSVIFVEPMEPEDIREGDIITYRGLGDSSLLTTHRVMGIEGSGQALEFITKGDANDVNDPYPIPGENLVGRVDAVGSILGVPYGFRTVKAGAPGACGHTRGAAYYK